MLQNILAVKFMIAFEKQDCVFWFPRSLPPI